MTIFRYALLRSLRRKWTLVVLWIAPSCLMLLSPLWEGGSLVGFSLYSMVILLAAFMLVQPIMEDRVNGTAVRIFAAPITTRNYLFQNLMAALVLLIVQIVVVLGSRLIWQGWDWPMAGKALLGYTVFAGTALALCLAWHSLFRSKALSDAGFSLLLSVMAFFGGVFVPITVLQGIMQNVAMMMPPYWLANALLSLDQSSGRTYWLSLGIMILFAAVFLTFGSKRRLE